MPEPLGVVLAGGRGRRLGGKGKATLPLAGVPLALRAIDAFSGVLARVVVVTKRDTPLPPGLEVPVWLEPDEPQHPLCGIVNALTRSDECSILVCAVDLPLVGEAELAALARADGGGHACVLAAPAGAPEALQPLLGRYERSALNTLRQALARRARLRELAVELGARPLALDPALLLNVNTPADVEAAEAALRERSPVSRRSPTSCAPAARIPAR